MFHSSSAFGVVASSSPQIVVIDHRIYTVEVIDHENHFSCDQSLQSYQDCPLDLSVRKQDKHEPIEHNGIPSEKATPMGCNSDQTQNLVFKTESSAENTACEIKITNVTSLATDHLANETGSLQDETPKEAIGEVETFPEWNPKSHINQPVMMHTISDYQSHLNNGRIQARHSPNHLTIRTSPSSIHGLKRIRPRPYRSDTLKHGKELSMKNKTTSPLALYKDYPKSVKHVRSIERMRNNDKPERKHGTQTSAMQGYSKQRKPMLILPSSHARYNPSPNESPHTPSFESTSLQKLQSSSALGSGLDTQTLRQNGAPNSSPQNYPEMISPSHTAPAKYSSKPLIKDPKRMKSIYHCTTPKGSGGKGGGNEPLSDEILVDLVVVRVHRRPYFQCKESRELVEVRPRGLADAPTLLAYRDVSGRILVDWTAKSNYRAAEKIKKLMQLNPDRSSHRDQDQVSGPAHTAAPTTTAQCPSDVMSLAANGVIYTISN